MRFELTASNLLHSIGQLSKDRIYNYPNPTSSTKFKIRSVAAPEGPITLFRWDANRGENTGKIASISSNVLWRVASSVRKNQPFQLDRILGASYNTRSLLEALLAHTAEFYLAKVQRIEFRSDSHSIKEGHKHLVWMPDRPHENGVFHWNNQNFTITESTIDNGWGEIDILEQIANEGLSEDIKRRHAQIQLAITEIGYRFDFRTYIARNDQGIKYGDKTFAELDGVVVNLSQENILQAFSDAQRAGEFIDAIWFNNSRFLPAVIEIEHSTGITSGLNRMSGFQQRLPSFSDTKFVIAGADDDRDKFLRKSSEPQFRELNPSFLPYSGVEELRYLANKGRLDCFAGDYRSAKKFFDGYLSSFN